ncbi:MAG: hypothetical protein RSF83_02685 [Hungatella sp.]
MINNIKNNYKKSWLYKEMGILNLCHPCITFLGLMLVASGGMLFMVMLSATAIMFPISLLCGWI